MKKSERYLSNCLYFTAGSLARKITKLADEAFAPLGLTPSYAFLLLLIAENPGISPSALGEQMNLDPSTITRLADKMIIRQFITKNQSGKTMHFQPTENLTQLLPALEKAWWHLKDLYDNRLGESSADQLVTLTLAASEKL